MSDEARDTLLATISVDLVAIRKAIDRLAGVIAATSVHATSVKMATSGVDPSDAMPAVVEAVMATFEDAATRAEAARK